MKRGLRLFTCFWGEKHLDLFEKALVRSLSWPLNKEALSHATWDLWTKSSEFGLVADVAKSVGIKLELHEADSFIEAYEKAEPNTPGADAGVMMNQMFKISIKRCLETNSQMLIAPPDTIFGGDSIANMLQAAEQPSSVVFVVHIRVLPSIIDDLEKQSNRFGPASSISNAKLVSIALRNAHKSFEEAEYGHERINSYIGGIFWKKRPNGVLSVQHMLPTPYVINWTKSDYDFFNRDNGPGQWPQVFGILDHTWPSVCVHNAGRARTLGSSDDAFICEITDPAANVPALMNSNPEDPDKFWRGAPHNHINKMFAVTLRGEE